MDENQTRLSWDWGWRTTKRAESGVRVLSSSEAAGREEVESGVRERPEQAGREELSGEELEPAVAVLVGLLPAAELSAPETVARAHEAELAVRHAVPASDLAPPAVPTGQTSLPAIAVVGTGDWDSVRGPTPTETPEDGPTAAWTPTPLAPRSPTPTETRWSRPEGTPMKLRHRLTATEK